MLRASSLLSASTIIHALWSPSLQPQSARVRKWEPLRRNASRTRTQAFASASCATSTRNRGMARTPRSRVTATLNITPGRESRPGADTGLLAPCHFRQVRLRGLEGLLFAPMGKVPEILGDAGRVGAVFALVEPRTHEPSVRA